jgi:hypothetical protein
MYINRENGSGDKILDWAVIIAALMLFLKTADVLSYFAPTNLNFIVGMDVSWLYGGVSALLVEGAALALHFNGRAKLSAIAQIVKWTLMAISASCQVYDGFITTNTAANMSDPLKLGLQYGVPLIPLVIMVLLFAVGRLPEDGVQPAPFRGIRNTVGPSLNRLWHGDPVSPNGSAQANPTNGEK